MIIKPMDHETNLNFLIAGGELAFLKHNNVMSDPLE